MSDTPNPWQVRTLPGDVHLVMWGGDVPALVDAAADLAEVLVGAGRYHA